MSLKAAVKLVPNSNPLGLVNEGGVKVQFTPLQTQDEVLCFIFILRYGD